MSRHQLRAVLPSIYIIAILIAVFFGSGASVGAVAAIGAIALGAAYKVLEAEPGTGRDRQRNRGAGDSAQYPAAYPDDRQPGRSDVQDS